MQKPLPLCELQRKPQKHQLKPITHTLSHSHTVCPPPSPQSPTNTPTRAHNKATLEAAQHKWKKCANKIRNNCTTNGRQCPRADERSKLLSVVSAAASAASVCSVGFGTMHFFMRLSEIWWHCQGCLYNLHVYEGEKENIPNAVFRQRDLLKLGLQKYAFHIVSMFERWIYFFKNLGMHF